MASSDESEEASSINESEDAPGEEEDAGEEDDEDEQAEQGRSSDSAGRLRGANDRDAMREMREQRAHKMLGGMFKKQEDPNEKESPKKKAAFSEKHRYRCANWAVPDSAAAKEAPAKTSEAAAPAARYQHTSVRPQGAAAGGPSPRGHLLCWRHLQR